MTYKVVFFRGIHRIYHLYNIQPEDLDFSVKRTIKNINQMSLKWDFAKVYNKSYRVLFIVHPEDKFEHIKEYF